jgi:hypothetical protein
MTVKRLRSVLILVTLATISTGCLSPFSDHGDDVRTAWARKGHQFHRRWDKYVLGLDWDDPTMEWKDESYATGPMHR